MKIKILILIFILAIIISVVVFLPIYNISYTTCGVVDKCWEIPAKVNLIEYINRL